MAGGDYGRIRHTFWTDPDIKRGLTLEQKALLLYYFTSPHSSLVGLYFCPLGYVASETGLAVELVREWTLGPLSKYLTYDEATEEVFVHRAGRHQVGDELKASDNRVRAIKRAIGETHSTRLVRDFLVLYAHWPLGIEPPDPVDNKPLGSPLPSPLEAPIAVQCSAVQLQSSASSKGLAAGDVGTLRSELEKHAEANHYGPKDRLIAIGEDTSAWRTNDGPLVPMVDRLRCLRLADAHLNEPGSKAADLRGALRYIIVQQFDPFVIQKAADRKPLAGKVAEGPTNMPADPRPELERLKAEHPEVYADAVRELEGYHWWETTRPDGRADEIRKLIRDKLAARPRIVA